MSDRSEDEYLQARRLADQFPPTLEDELRLARIAEARVEEDERLLQFYRNFLTFRPRQLALCFPPETLFNLERDPRFEVWTDHSIIVRSIRELLEFKIFSQAELDRFVDVVLPRAPGAAQAQLFYWHLRAATDLHDRPVDRIFVTENSHKFWFELVPPQAAHIRNQIRANRHIYYWTRFELNHQKIEFGFREIRLITNPAAAYTPLAPEHTFCTVEGREFTYWWHVGIWETTLVNSDPRLIDPEGYSTVPIPGATARVLTEEELVRPGIGYPGIANQVPQASEDSEEESIDIGELIELASAAEQRPPSSSSGSSLPASSDVYTPQLASNVPVWQNRAVHARDRSFRPRSCLCQGREVCTCGYRPDTPPTPPHIQLWEPRDLVLPSQSWIYPE